MCGEDAAEPANGGALVAPVAFSKEQKQEPERVLVFQVVKLPSCRFGLRQAAGAERSSQAGKGRSVRAHRTDVRICVKARGCPCASGFPPL